jgi:hypothetical protein
MWWLILLPGAVALVYLGLPLLTWKLNRFEETPTIQRIDPNDLPLPTDVRQHLDKVEADLLGIGFESRSTLLLPSAAPNVISILRVFVNPLSKVSAMANSMITTTKSPDGDQVQHVPYVEFTTRYDNGQVFNTLNASAASSFPPAEQSLTSRVHWVQDAIAVHMIHHLITASRGSGRRVLRLDHAFAGDEIAYLQACMKEEFEHGTNAGYLQLGTDGASYRPTLRGACFMTWKLLPPFKQWRAWRDRARVEGILRDSGITLGRSVRPL